jgi:hypothetical protein
MIRGFALRYLARLAEGASIPEAKSSLPFYARALALPSAKKHAVAAAFSTDSADDSRHVHRLAYLLALGKEATNPNDVEAVRVAYEKHRSTSAEARAPLVFALSCLGVALALGGAFGAYRMWTRRLAVAPPPLVLADGTTLTPPPAAPIEEAHPLTPLFTQALPEWVVSLDAESLERPRPAPSDVAGTHAALLAALADQPTLIEPATHFLDAAESFVRTPSTSARFQQDESVVTEALVHFNDALGAAQLPFYVDAHMSQRNERRRVLASTYRITARRNFRSGERAITSLDLTRLDTLSFEQTLLGYTRPDVRYALVLTAQMEEHLVQQVLPSMHSPDESVMVVGYEDERDTSWLTPYETAAHEDLRREHAALLSESAVGEVAAAVARRRHAYDALQGEVQGTFILQPIPTYLYDLTSLEGVLQRAQSNTRRELRDAQSAMQSPSLAASFQTLREVALHSVALHECQHRIDYEDDRVVNIPEMLAAYVGRTESETRVNQLAERTNAELSAHLSQVAREPQLAFTNLLQVAVFAMNRRTWGNPYSYAAIVIHEALAQQFGIAHGPLVQGGRIQRGELANIYLALRTHSGEALSQAALRAWHALYGIDLPPLVPEN